MTTLPPPLLTAEWKIVVFSAMRSSKIQECHINSLPHKIPVNSGIRPYNMQVYHLWIYVHWTMGIFIPFASILKPKEMQLLKVTTFLKMSLKH